MPNPPQGCSYLYGHGAVESFLRANQLVDMIHAHQCKEEGVGYTYANNRIIDYKFPYITTVFSPQTTVVPMATRQLSWYSTMTTYRSALS